MTKINEYFSVSTFTDKRFSATDYNAIAYSLLVDNRDGQQKIAPCVPTTVGEYKHLMFDDTLPLIIYHKVLNKQYAYIKEEADFGRKNGRNLRATASMQMIILANRHIIRILPEDLETLVVTNFPHGNESYFQSISSALSGIAIKPVASDFNYERLWQQEFRGYDFNVNPDRAMLSVNYTIESAFKTKCFNLCDCAGESGQ